MNNEPVFPITNLSKTQCTGMSLRDYFASKAMQGFAASDLDWDAEKTAKASYKLADEMLKARG